MALFQNYERLFPYNYVKENPHLTIGSAYVLCSRWGFCSKTFLLLQI